MRLNENPSPKNLRALKQLYRSAFPINEKKPFGLMLKKQAEGTMKLATVEDENGTFLGLVITIHHKDIVLLDYFAVSPAVRGKGIGSEVLSLLKNQYSGKRILLEIEDPEEPCKNRKERLRRKDFYLRNGLSVQNYKVWLFGVKMLILTNGAIVSFEEYHEIFETVFSSKTAKHVILA